jgi:hypothetical protein
MQKYFWSLFTACTRPSWPVAERRTEIGKSGRELPGAYAVAWKADSKSISIPAGSVTGRESSPRAR